MKPYILFLLPFVVTAAEPRDILRSAIFNFQKDQVASLRYIHTETEDIKGKGVEVSQLTVIDGTPYERVISRNGQPLTGDAERREHEKFRKAQAERAGESDAEREKRIRKYHDGASLLTEGQEAFHITLVREENVAGRPAYLLDLLPKPGYRPRNMKLKMFVGVHARVWIDKQDLRISKAEATVVDTVALGWIMARICKGGHLGFEQLRLADGTWVPRQYLIQGSARIFLVDERRIEQTVTFTGYQPISHHAGEKVAERASN